MTPFAALMADGKPPFFYELVEVGVKIQMGFWRNHYIATADQVTMIVGPLVNTTLSNLRTIANHGVHSAGFFKGFMVGPCVREVDLSDPQGLEQLEKVVEECKMISKIHPATSKGRSRTSHSSPATPSGKKV